MLSFGVVAWEQMTIGVAALAALVYVVREMRGMRRDDTEVTLATTEVLRQMTSQLSTLNEKTDRLHDDNVETARLLHKADDETVRKVEDQGGGS